jgi:hypothetical protein
MKKAIAILVLILIVFGANAQKKRPGYSGSGFGPANPFLKQQWWLGFKAGVNLVKADPLKRYTILTPTNYPSSLTEKTYDNFRELGVQASLEISYYYKGFYFSTQPRYISSTFTYSNELKWVNSINEAESLTQTYEQSQKVEYADFPFIIKYDITGDNLRPFVQVGVFYSLLLNAVKTVRVSGIDQASGGTNVLTSEPLIVGTKDLFDNYLGLMGGVGASYQMGNVKVIVDAYYRQSLGNVVNTKNRFSNDRLSGIGDAQDDLSLKNIVVSMGVVFPMRYLSNSFKSSDR